jgi:hypothetical protein
MNMLEKLGLAIEMASDKRFVGLYDYSGYRGTEPPHVVRDEVTGREVFRSSDPFEARRVYDRMKRDAVAQAVLAILRDPDEGMVEAGARAIDAHPQNDVWAWSKSSFTAAIDHAAKGEG